MLKRIESVQNLKSIFFFNVESVPKVSPFN